MIPWEDGRRHEEGGDPMNDEDPWDVDEDDED
jgi:hypothetical protein